MLYVCERKNFDRCVVDSETGEKVILTRRDDRYWYNGRPFSIDTLVGYLSDDTLHPVPKELIGLLSYIDEVTFLGEYMMNSILVSWCLPVAYSSHNILIRLSSSNKVVSVLDVILCLSYNKNFWEILKTGEAFAKFNVNECMKIKFCGSYMSYISKLVTFYRNTGEFQSRMELEGML